MRRRRGALPDVGERRGGLRTTKESYLNMHMLNQTYVDTVIARTGAVLQDVVGLDFDGGHHVIEITQVRRRKQHPEQEGKITNPF